MLKVKNAFFLDTGYYYCIVNGTTDFSNSLNNVTHIYVYVKGKQKTQILHFPAPLEREIPIMKCSVLWSAATFENIPRIKYYTIILALQCLYHFLYLQKNDLYTKFFKLGYTCCEILKFCPLKWWSENQAVWLKRVMKFSINYTITWTMMILLLKCII